jgi:GTP-binding protein
LGETGSADSFIVYGRAFPFVRINWNNASWGYELQIGQPQVIFREINGARCEPIEELTIDLPEPVPARRWNCIDTEGWNGK